MIPRMNAYVFKELIELIISGKHINQFRDNLKATSLQKPEGMDLNGFNGYEVYEENHDCMLILCCPFMSFPYHFICSINDS